MSLATSYCSGAGNITDLVALIEVGAAIGVELGRLDGPSRSAIIEYAKGGGKVMVDSGAFGAFKKGLKIDFDQIMLQYEQLVWATGGNIAIVAPDIIGEQEKTFALLEKYRTRLCRLIRIGATVLVPLQKGALGPYQAWQAAVKILSTDRFVVAIPSNKAAFSDEDLAELLSGEKKPAQIHFLGMTTASRNWARKKAIVLTFSPSTTISMDGCRIKAMIGKGRAITTCQTQNRSKLVEDGFSGFLAGL